MNLYSAREMTELLERHGFFFKKNLGQNFLMNEATAARIAEAGFQTMSGKRKTLAVEIGPGAGSLTIQLASRFDEVLSLEIDPHLIPVLQESLAGIENVTVEKCDALSFHYSCLTDRYPDYEVALCSNLPYYITTELIMRALESKIALSSITVLIQKEAAARLSAAPDTKDYGAITASVSYYAKTKRLFTVSPGNFIPKPKVDSAVLQIIPYTEKPIRPLNEEMFFKVIRAAFSARRKTLINSLSSSFSDFISKDELTDLIAQCGISPTVRGETLSILDFKLISDKIAKTRKLP